MPGEGQNEEEEYYSGLYGSRHAPPRRFERERRGRDRGYGDGYGYGYHYDPYRYGRLPGGVFPLESRRSSGNERMRSWYWD